jgi:ribosomal protein L19
LIDKIDILRRSKVRRAKLYYIREKAAKEVRRKMKPVLIEKEVKDEEAAQEVVA